MFLIVSDPKISMRNRIVQEKKVRLWTLENPVHIPIIIDLENVDYSISML